METKAYGISLLAKDLGIRAEEIMTLGDEENDLPMIEYAYWPPSNGVKIYFSTALATPSWSFVSVTTSAASLTKKGRRKTRDN
jgi:hypothetical protein